MRITTQSVAITRISQKHIRNVKNQQSRAQIATLASTTNHNGGSNYNNTTSFVRSSNSNQSHSLVPLRSIQSSCSSRNHRTFSTTTAIGRDNKESDEKNRKIEDHKHCVDLVQSRDYEGYLCGLLLPHKARPHYFALRAFNIEIASIKDGGAIPKQQRQQSSSDMPSSSNNIASRLRMQWWRDAIDFLYVDTEVDSSNSTSSTSFTTTTTTSSFQHNPIVRSLNETIKSKNLTKRFLQRMMDAREADLDVMQYSTMDDLIRYSEQTMCSLMYLNLECCDVMDEDADVVASHVGVGVGLVTVIRSIVARAAGGGGGGEIGIPMDLMEKHNVPLRYIQDPPASAAGMGVDNSGNPIEEEDHDVRAREAVQDAVKEMAFMARAHLQHARIGQGKVPKDGRSCLLPAVLSLQYLDQLEKVEYNVLHADLNTKESFEARLSHFKKSLLLMRAWLTGIF